MYIEVPVLWYPDDGEDKENLKLEVTLEKGTINLNTNAICAYHEHDNGNTMLRISNGDVFQCLLKYKEFKKIIEDIECTMDLVISNDN